MIKKQSDKIIVLIPSLEPDSSLLTYVQELRAYGLTDLIIVDDGSGEEYQTIFNQLQQSGCVVLRHAENRGKGYALKTGFQYIKDRFGYCSCIVTADADGQHAAHDVYHVAQKSKVHPGALALGVRDFTAAGIPPKSLLGNRITTLAFTALYGKWLPDTQTGLRAFGPELLAFMLDIPGSRFEYEIQMLISCTRSGVPMLTLPIEVIYEKGNKGTHFKPIRDSVQIMGILLADFMKFLFSSLAGAAVDLAIAWVLLDLLRPLLGQQAFLRILLATGLARVISIAVNYTLNKTFVFQRKNANRGSLRRYLALCALLILLSAAGVYGMHELFDVDERLGKLIGDIVLFVLSYQVQQRWVFAKGGRHYRAQ